MAREATRRARTKAVAAPIAAKVKMSASVQPQTYMRLATHALWLGKTQGELIDELVEGGCKRFRVQDLESTSKTSLPTDPSPDPADPADETAAA